MGVKKEKVSGKLIINEYDSSNLKGSELLSLKKGENIHIQKYR